MRMYRVGSEVYGEDGALVALHTRGRWYRPVRGSGGEHEMDICADERAAEYEVMEVIAPVHPLTAALAMRANRGS